MKIASSKSIWVQGGRFDGEDVSSFFSSGGGGGGVVRYRGVINEKSPDFRSPEVGISAFMHQLWSFVISFMGLSFWFQFHQRDLYLLRRR